MLALVCRLKVAHGLKIVIVSNCHTRSSRPALDGGAVDTC
jgi:hypothetical protein